MFFGLLCTLLTASLNSVDLTVNLQLHPMYRLALHGGCCCTVAHYVHTFSPIILDTLWLKKTC